MDPATLRIKFTPLIKYFPKNSPIYSLEIVPELSGIQNLEKINWNNKCDLIEYILPMTYKIILKKNHPHNSNVPSDNLNKIYHSCVDLLLSPPLNLASCDIQRMLSDTYVPSKTTADITDVAINTKSEKFNSFVTTQNQNTSNNDVIREIGYQYVIYNNFNKSLQATTPSSEIIEVPNPKVKECEGN